MTTTAMLSGRRRAQHLLQLGYAAIHHRDAADGDLVIYPAPAMCRSLSNPNERLQESLEIATSAAVDPLLMYPVAIAATERNGRFGHVG
jgi:hypothetical protein